MAGLAGDAGVQVRKGTRSNVYALEQSLQRARERDPSPTEEKKGLGETA